MKNNKKLKIKKLNFYIIDDNYIEYLSQFDKHIAYNKNEKRPYIGVVLIVEEHYYFAPLFSPKQKHKTYKDNLTFFKIINEKTKNDLGIIRFSDMIPVPQESVYLLDIQINIHTNSLKTFVYLFSLFCIVYLSSIYHK